MKTMYIFSRICRQMLLWSVTSAFLFVAAGHSGFAHTQRHVFPFGQPGKAEDVNRDVAIVMKDISFDPASVTVKAGEIIRFHVKNQSNIDHDFTLGDEKTQVEHRKEMAEMAEMMGPGSEMHHDAEANAIMVKAGQEADLIWKFTRSGTLEFDCNIPGHYEGGMKGIITVTE